MAQNETENTEVPAQPAGDEAVVSVVNPARLAALDPIMYTSEMLTGSEGSNVNVNAR